jgi:hypothetical protein
MFQIDTKETEGATGHIRRVSEQMCSGGEGRVRTSYFDEKAAKCRAGYLCKRKILWKTPTRFGYNLRAFNFAVVCKYPALQRACLHYPASFSAYFNTKRNTVTPWKQEQ